MRRSDDTCPQVATPIEVLSMFAPGMRVFLPGVCSESLLIRQLLADHPDAAAGVHFFGVFVPGINSFDYARLHETTQFTGPFVVMPRQAQRHGGRVRHLPLGYSQLYRSVADDVFDIAFLHVAPPDENGNCSLGITADFASAAIQRARRVVAHVNPKMPSLPGASINLREIDFVVEDSAELDETARAQSAFSLDGFSQVAHCLLPTHCGHREGSKPMSEVGHETDATQPD